MRQYKKLFTSHIPSTQQMLFHFAQLHLSQNQHCPYPVFFLCPTQLFDNNKVQIFLFSALKANLKNVP